MTHALTLTLMYSAALAVCALYVFIRARRLSARSASQRYTSCNNSVDTQRISSKFKQFDYVHPHISYSRNYNDAFPDCRFSTCHPSLHSISFYLSRIDVSLSGIIYFSDKRCFQVLYALFSSNCFISYN